MRQIVELAAQSLPIGREDGLRLVVGLRELMRRHAFDELHGALMVANKIVECVNVRFVLLW